MNRRKFLCHSALVVSGSLLVPVVQGAQGLVNNELKSTDNLVADATLTDGKSAIAIVKRVPREFVSVKDFGAVGNGIVDDTVAIQAAINYGSMHNTNIFIPSGVYLCSDSIYLYYDSVLNPDGNSNETNAGSFRIKGEGRFAHLQFVTGVASWIGSVLHFTHPTKDGFIHSKLTPGATNVPPACKGIEDLSIVCNTTGWVMNLAWFSRAVVSNVGVFNENVAGNGIKLLDCWEYSLKDCMIAARALSSGVGIQIRNINSQGGSVEEVRGCTVLYFTKGITVGQVGQVGQVTVNISTMIDYNLIYGCVTGIECDSGSWKTVISRNYFEGAKGTDILILAALATDIQNNAHSATSGLAAYIRIDLSKDARGTRVWQNFFTLASNEIGIKISGQKESNSVLANNHFVATGTGNGRQGIYAVGNSHQQSLVTGNSFENIENPYSGAIRLMGRLDKYTGQFFCSVAENEPVFVTQVAGDLCERFQVDATGVMVWGAGNVPPDTSLSRIGVGVLRNQAGGKIVSQGGFGVGNSIEATTLGDVVKKIEIFDNVGVSLGFIPVYKTIE